jgi:hypothetical protein
MRSTDWGKVGGPDSNQYRGGVASHLRLRYCDNLYIHWRHGARHGGSTTLACAQVGFQRDIPA